MKEYIIQPLDISEEEDHALLVAEYDEISEKPKIIHIIEDQPSSFLQEINNEIFQSIKFAEENSNDVEVTLISSDKKIVIKNFYKFLQTKYAFACEELCKKIYDEKLKQNVENAKGKKLTTLKYAVRVILGSLALSLMMEASPLDTNATLPKNNPFDIDEPIREDDPYYSGPYTKTPQNEKNDTEFKDVDEFLEFLNNLDEPIPQTKEEPEIPEPIVAEETETPQVIVKPSTGQLVYNGEIYELPPHVEEEEALFPKVEIPVEGSEEWNIILAVIGQEGGYKSVADAIAIADVITNRARDKNSSAIEAVTKKDQFLAFKDKDGNQLYKNYLDKNGDVYVFPTWISGIADGRKFFMTQECYDAAKEELRKARLGLELTYDYDEFDLSGKGDQLSEGGNWYRNSKEYQKSR